MERPRDMDIQKFEVFLKIIETGSLTRAADMMDYTQSAVSHAISTLESEFNVRLLVRDRSGVKLTSDGRALLPYIRSVINAYREFQNKTAAINNRQKKMGYNAARELLIRLGLDDKMD